MSIIKITKHGQITIPKKFREVLGLAEGDLAEAELEDERIVITPKRLVEDKALQELKIVLKEVHEKNKGVSEEEVVKYATQAIAEFRSKKYDKHWVQTLCGKYRDVLTPTEQYFKEKQEEIELEEDKLARHNA